MRDVDTIAKVRKDATTEEKKQTKKRVYVETTVVSDATALPTNGLSVAGRIFVCFERL